MSFFFFASSCFLNVRFAWQLATFGETNALCCFCKSIIPKTFFDAQSGSTSSFKYAVAEYESLCNNASIVPGWCRLGVAPVRTSAEKTAAAAAMQKNARTERPAGSGTVTIMALTPDSVWAVRRPLKSRIPGSLEDVQEKVRVSFTKHAYVDFQLSHFQNSHGHLCFSSRVPLRFQLLSNEIRPGEVEQKWMYENR